MPDWLIESNPSLYFLLAAAAIGFATAWWRTRQRKYAIAAGVSLALLVAAYLSHRLVESDREQMVRKIGEMSVAVRGRQIDRVFEHVSDSFLTNGVDKKGFRAYAESRNQSRFVEEFVAWDFEPGPTSRESRAGELRFFFKVRGSFGETPPGYFARTLWVYDSDGQWRLKGYELYNSINDSKTPVAVPGWGR